MIDSKTMPVDIFAQVQKKTDSLNHVNSPELEVYFDRIDDEFHSVKKAIHILAKVSNRAASGTMVTFNLKDCKYIGPCGVVIILQYKKILEIKNINSHLIPPVNDKVYAFLKFSGLCKEFSIDNLPDSSHAQNETLRLIVFDTMDIQWMKSLRSLVEKHLSLSSDASELLQSTISELKQNIFDHSQSPKGIICARSFTNVKSVRFAITDYGVGIPKAIIEKYHSKSESEAIKLAFMPDVSKKSRERNRGLGLSNLHIVTRNSYGDLFAFSKTGAVACNKSTKWKISVRKRLQMPYEGTLIFASFSFKDDDYLLDNSGEQFSGEMDI